MTKVTFYGRDSEINKVLETDFEKAEEQVIAVLTEMQLKRWRTNYVSYVKQ